MLMGRRRKLRLMARFIIQLACTPPRYYILSPTKSALPLPCLFRFYTRPVRASVTSIRRKFRQIPYATQPPPAKRRHKIYEIGYIIIAAVPRAKRLMLDSRDASDELLKAATPA